MHASLRQQLARCARSSLRSALACAALAAAAAAQGNQNHSGEPGNVPGLIPPGFKGAADSVAPSGRAAPTAANGTGASSLGRAQGGVAGPVIAAPPIDV